MTLQALRVLKATGQLLETEMGKIDTIGKWNRGSAVFLLRTFLVCMAVLVSNGAAAEDSFLLNPDFDGLKDGDVMIAPIGYRGAGIRMLVTEPGQLPAASQRVFSNGMLKGSTVSAEARLSIVVPW